MKIKLGEPWAGWSEIYLKDNNGKEFAGALSYIDSVPLMFLNAAINYKNGEDVVLNFDEEGTSFIMVLCHYEDLYIISLRGENPELITLDISPDEFFRKVVLEIEGNLRNWAEWDVFGDSEEEIRKEADENERTLQEKIRLFKKSPLVIK